MLPSVRWHNLQRTGYYPPPMTLEAAAAAGVRLIVWCQACQHQIEPDPGELAGGLKARIFSLRQRGREWYDAELCRFEAEPVTGCHHGILPVTWPVPSRGRPLCDGLPRDRRQERERLMSSRPANGSARLGSPYPPEGCPMTRAAPRRGASPLTPSLLARTANPRHDPRWRRKRLTVSGFPREPV